MNNKTMLIIACGKTTKALADWGFRNIPKEIDTVGMGMAYRHFESIGWFPSHYGQLDAKVVFHHQEQYRALIERHPEVVGWFFSLSGNCVPGKIDLGKPDNISLHHHGGSGESLVDIMINPKREYRRILLIGFDGVMVWNDDWVSLLNAKNPTDNRGTILNAAEFNKNYFCDDYYQNGDVLSCRRHTGNLSETKQKRSDDRWNQRKKKAKKAGIAVYNLVPGQAIPFECPYNSIAEAFQESE